MLHHNLLTIQLSQIIGLRCPQDTALASLGSPAARSRLSAACQVGQQIRRILLLVGPCLCLVIAEQLVFVDVAPLSSQKQLVIVSWEQELLELPAFLAVTVSNTSETQEM